MSKGLKKAEAETKPDETEVEKSGEEDEEKVPVLLVVRAGSVCSS